MLVVEAGPKLHESIYGAIFTWRNEDIPCSAGSLLKNPRLIEGGFSPGSEISIAVRDSAFTEFTGAHRPTRGEHCAYKSHATATTRLMRVATCDIGVGDSVWLLTLEDRNQGA